VLVYRRHAVGTPLVRSGVGDFSDPSCPPGQKGCVPHWYCYIPGMATPDCWASFQTGLTEIAAAPGQLVTQTIQSAVKGVACGIFGKQIQDDGSCACSDPNDFWCQYGMWAILAAVGALVVVPAIAQRRRR
jgi:hypothetical protein